MTSIMHPALAVSKIADQALASLNAGNDVLLGREIRPMHEPFPGTTPTTRFARAATHGDAAVAHIDRALGYTSNLLSRSVISALTSARSEAQTGVMMLRAKTMVPLDPNSVVLKFDGAKLWLDMAKSLIQLDLGNGPRPTEPIVVRPPVTILPVEVEAPEAMAR